MNRLIRHQAKELAGVFYEDNRSPAFRQTYPTVKHYMKGLQVTKNGSIKVDKPGWLYHVDLALKVLRGMLALPNVHENIKQPIYEALLEYGKAAVGTNAKSLTQAKHR